jgi:hypothetical protein
MFAARVLAAGRDDPGRADLVELGEQPGQRGGSLTWILGALNERAMRHRHRPPSREPLPSDPSTTTSSSHRDGLPLSAGVRWASMPTIWSALTSPSPCVCTHTFVKLTVTSRHVVSLLATHNILFLADK